MADEPKKPDSAPEPTNDDSWIEDVTDQEAAAGIGYGIGAAPFPKPGSALEKLRAIMKPDSPIVVESATTGYAGYGFVGARVPTREEIEAELAEQDNQDSPPLPN